MRKITTLFLAGIALVLTNCVRHGEETFDSVIVEEGERVEIEYAKGFEVSYEDGYIRIITRALDQNEPFTDSVFIVVDTAVSLGEEYKQIHGNGNQIACQSSTYLAFLDELSSLNQVVGLCGMEYVNNDSLLRVLQANNVVEICLKDQVQTEAVYQTNADLFLIYPFGKVEDYDQKGINTLLIAEYLEESQLARLEWIKLFGLLTGKTREANRYFEKVKATYSDLKSGVEKQDETFIMNLPYADQWFMPSSKSVGVQLIEDAGINYYYRGQDGTENIAYSNERVWEDGIFAGYWIIIARRPEGFGMTELLAEAAVYKEFKSVKNNQVIFCNTAEVDYFSRGVIEPDVILKDLLYATGQIEAHQPSYFFRLE